MRASLLSCLSLLVATSALLADDGPAPTLAELSYGPHAANVLDFWKAEGDGPRPLLVYIHGGGWRGGDKQRSSAAYVPFLDRGVSYAAVNYRLSGEASLPAPVHDAARAIQFIRSKAEEWNIDPDRIALTGGSAGACSSMWILLHDDLADPDADDPVLRQSTRVTAAAVSGGQTSIDPMVIEPWLGPNVLKHSMIWTSVGAATMEAALEDYDQYRELYEEFSPYNHLDADDPPLFMTYGNNMTLPSENAGHGIHHPVYGVKMQEKADELEHECYLLIPRRLGSRTVWQRQRVSAGETARKVVEAGNDRRLELRHGNGAMDGRQRCRADFDAAEAFGPAVSTAQPDTEDWFKNEHGRTIDAPPRVEAGVRCAATASSAWARPIPAIRLRSRPSRRRA